MESRGDGPTTAYWRTHTMADMRFFSFGSDAINGGKKRPYEVIAEALQTWESGNSARADQLFSKGIAAYRRDEPDGVDFALGRYGAFLLDQGRMDDAEKVLKQAIDLKTDIPAIRSDYLGIFLHRRDMNALKRAVESMSSSANGRIAPEFLLAHARTADRDGATSFAEELARWVVERCSQTKDHDGRWAAIGDLGRILERADRLEEAMTLWRSAFDEGSRDSETITRLTMNLERAKDYATEISVIREALTRRMPANVEEALRKRLIRCEEKGVAKGQKSKKRTDVSAYSVRQDSTLFEPLFQIRLKSSVSDISVVNGALRCLLTSKESSTLVDFNLESGTEIHRAENLPLLGSTVFSSDGRGIGVRRTAAVGKGPTLLRFLSADGRLVAQSEVPDATSEIACGPRLWYVGCRNGFLYAFDFDGRQCWKWETPGASKSTDNAYFRPCPYYVSSHGSFAAVASMGNIYAVEPNGRTLWHAAIPNEHQTKWDWFHYLEKLANNNLMQFLACPSTRHGSRSRRHTGAWHLRPILIAILKIPTQRRSSERFKKPMSGFSPAKQKMVLAVSVESQLALKSRAWGRSPALLRLQPQAYSSDRLRDESTALIGEAAYATRASLATALFVWPFIPTARSVLLGAMMPCSSSTITR